MNLRSSVLNTLEYSSNYDPSRHSNISTHGWCCLSHAVIMFDILNPNPVSVIRDVSFQVSDDDDDDVELAHQQSLEEGRIKYAAEVAAEDAIDDAAQIAMEISIARDRVLMAKLDLEKKARYAAALDRQANRLLEIANRTAEEKEAIDLQVIQNNLQNDAFLEIFFGVGWLQESN
jgi:hypothetical protein